MQREYHQLAKRHDRFIKRYDEVMGQMQSYRQQAYHMEAKCKPKLKPADYQLQGKRMEQRLKELAHGSWDEAPCSSHRQATQAAHPRRISTAAVRFFVTLD